MRNLLMRRERKPAELLLVPMIDIFTVLVTFLLMTAVFSRITIMQIDLPSSAAAKPAEPLFRLEVIIRKDGFELSDGKQAIGTIPKVNDAYDLSALTARVLDVKREHPRRRRCSRSGKFPTTSSSRRWRRSAARKYPLRMRSSPVRRSRARRP